MECAVLRWKFAAKRRKQCCVQRTWRRMRQSRPGARRGSRGCASPMKFLSTFLCRRRRRFGAALALAGAGAAVACGPDFPNSYFLAPEEEMLRAPQGIFAAEIARLVAEVHMP